MFMSKLAAKANAGLRVPTARAAGLGSRWPFDLARTKATDWCGEAERASAATGLSFTFALVAKDLLLLPIEKIT